GGSGAGAPPATASAGRSGGPGGLGSARGAGLDENGPAASGRGAAEVPPPAPPPPATADGWAATAAPGAGSITAGGFRPRRPEEVGLPGSVPFGVHDTTVRSGAVLDEAEIRRLVALIERRVLAELERRGRLGPGMGGTW